MPPAPTKNPLLQLAQLGQSIWYDNLSRDLVTGGQLQAMVNEDGLRGVTSNPAIFEKALAAGGVYDAEMAEAVAADVGDAKAIFETLAVRDIQLAADVLRPVYDATRGADGFVSLEVSPYLAADSDATLEEARRLWATVDRPNLMIKVPGTPEGAPAIEALIADGIHVNVTLLFAVDAYETVARAYMAGLETRAARGERVDHVGSVASFFVSRIDAWVDQRLQQEIDEGRGDAKALAALQGKAALANAALAYGACAKLLASERWRALAAAGARTQRLLWASTSTKNPSYPKTLYVDHLVAPDTVNTLPAATYDEVKAGAGAPQRALLSERGETGISEARDVMAALEAAGISMKECTDDLLAQGVVVFADAFDTLLSEVERKRRGVLGSALASQTLSLGDATEAVENALESWRRDGSVRRLWAADATLWTDMDEARWLGWLHATDHVEAALAPLLPLAEEVRAAQFQHVVLLGMGGSSLCPDLLARTFGRQPGWPELCVLDSTVPAQIARLAAQIDPARSLFVVASKSGSTIEPTAFMQFFWGRVADAVGESAAGAHFIAITDPGSSLEEHARAHGFRAIVHGDPAIGGRFSALSPFGLLPAALLGLDVRDWMLRARKMAEACAACVPAANNPGIALGVALGVLANQGRDKLSLVPSPGLRSLGGWLEQLVAESTGKNGRGIIPIDGAPLPAPAAAGTDRVFVSLRLASDQGPLEDATATGLAALERAGHPVVRIVLDDPRQLGQEFFRWEVATAAAGAVLGLNPFDQPDVEAAKGAARQRMARFEETGALPPRQAVPVDAPDLEAQLRTLLGGIGPGDYFAVNAYLDMSDEHMTLLQRLRQTVGDARGVATTLGFGPRFLHSTGQLHKGGPASGVFLQLVADDAPLAIPGQPFGFDVLCAAQSEGDREVLLERGRRLLSVNLGADPAAGLARLAATIERCTANG